MSAIQHIHVIHGPNLHHIGQRTPEIYGNQSFDTFFQGLIPVYPQLTLHYFQSHHEGELIAYLYAQEAASVGFVLNPGALAHTSLALADALAAIQSPCIEVHISNVFARSAVRHHSHTAPHTQGVIIGIGLTGYRLAIDALLAI